MVSLASALPLSSPNIPGLGPESRTCDTPFRASRRRCHTSQQPWHCNARNLCSDRRKIGAVSYFPKDTRHFLIRELLYLGADFCTRRNVSCPPGAIGTQFAGKFRNCWLQLADLQRLKAVWWWLQSRTNRSPGQFPANREIYREFSSFCSQNRMKNFSIDLILRELLYLSPRSGRHRTGKFHRISGNRLSLISRFSAAAAAMLLNNWHRRVTHVD